MYLQVKVFPVCKNDVMLDNEMNAVVFIVMTLPDVRSNQTDF